MSYDVRSTDSLFHQLMLNPEADSFFHSLVVEACAEDKEDRRLRALAVLWPAANPLQKAQGVLKAHHVVRPSCPPFRRPELTLPSSLAVAASVATFFPFYISPSIAHSAPTGPLPQVGGSVEGRVEVRTRRRVLGGGRKGAEGVLRS